MPGEELFQDFALQLNVGAREQHGFLAAAGFLFGAGIQREDVSPVLLHSRPGDRWQSEKQECREGDPHQGFSSVDRVV